MRTCWSFRLCASSCWTRWRVGTKRNETLCNIQWQQPPPPKKKKKEKKKKEEEEVRDDDSDTDSDNEMLMKSETNWPRFLIVETASEDLTLQKLSPFAVQKGSQAIARSFLDTKD